VNGGLLRQEPPVHRLPFTQLLNEAFLRERLDDSLDIGPERFAVGVLQRSGDGVGDVVGIVPPVAVGEHEGRGKVEVVVARAGAVVQQKAYTHRVEAEVSSRSGVAATADLLLHIT
jgi:hypothetical protein